MNRSNDGLMSLMITYIISRLSTDLVTYEVFSRQVGLIDMCIYTYIYIHVYAFYIYIENYIYIHIYYLYVHTNTFSLTPPES